jgi:group I intron endonuclease
MGYIYLITNKITKKQYVGQTIRPDINERWKRHRYCDKRYVGQILYNAYKKYGIENFDYKIICICFDEDTNKYEEEYIKKYNTIYPNGYNLLSGGNNRTHNEYTLKRIREKLSGINHPNYGVKYSKERCDAMSKRMIGDKNPNYGKKYTKEEIERRLETRKLKNLENYNISGMITNQETRDKISNSLKEYYKTNTKTNSNNVRINQYTLNGDYVKSYYSISEASRAMGVASVTIGRASSNERKFSNYKTSCGFIWKREEVIP